jgi:hypothetical protein
MTQIHTFKLNRVSLVLISIALLFVTLLTTAFASGSSVKEVLSSSCVVPLRVSVRGPNFGNVGAEVDLRLAGESAAAKCAAAELASGLPHGIDFLGIAFDIRSAQDLAAARSAAAELASGAALGIEFDFRAAQDLAAAKDAAAELASGAALGIEFDFRVAQDLAAAKGGAVELASGTLGIENDIRLAEEIAGARDAVEGWVEGAATGIDWISEQPKI